MNRSNVSTAISELSDWSYLERQRDPDDRRKVVVRIEKQQEETAIRSALGR